MAILEGCESFDERTWYLRAALGHHWTKVELLEQLEQFIKEQDTAYSCIIKVEQSYTAAHQS